MENADISSGKRGRGAWLWIVAASLVAHVWCLGSVFYLDDWEAIVDNVQARDFQLLPVNANTWTVFWYALEMKLFGPSPVGFHAVNLMLHTGVALALYFSARDYLGEGRKAGVAWFAALLFAVHPLASEIPNYARTQDLAWVTLFSLLAAWSVFRWLRGGGWKWFAGMALFALGACLSKGPGFMHVAMAVVVVGLAALDRTAWTRLSQRWPVVAATTGVAAAALWYSGICSRAAQWLEPRVIGHAYTLCRVFWEFTWRAVVPAKLSADHQIAETLVPAGTWFGIADHVAQWSAAGLLLFTAASLILAWRTATRWLGVCGLMFAGSILMRMFYMIPEFMPEYRVYPGLPWFCLGSAIVLAAVWRRFAGGGQWIAGGLLIVGFAALSARRSFQFHDIHTLMKDVLAQYPTQLRAVWVMQRADLDAGRNDLVIERQRAEVPRIRGLFVKRLGELAPARELPTGHFSLAETGCWGISARALAAKGASAVAMQEMDRLYGYMEAMRISPDTNPIHWLVYWHDRALVLEACGRYDEALAALDKSGPLYGKRQLDRDRIRRKAGK